MSESKQNFAGKRHSLPSTAIGAAKEEIVVAAPTKKPSIRSNRWVNIPYKEGLTDLQPLLQEDVARLRGAFRDQLAAAFPDAVKAMRGEVKWTSAQVNLFRIFANKDVPDLSQSHTTVEHTHREASKLTREELEALVAESAKPLLPTEGSE